MHLADPLFQPHGPAAGAGVETGLEEKPFKSPRGDNGLNGYFQGPGDISQDLRRTFAFAGFKLVRSTCSSSRLKMGTNTPSKPFPLVAKSPFKHIWTSFNRVIADCQAPSPLTGLVHTSCSAWPFSGIPTRDSLEAVRWYTICRMALHSAAGFQAAFAAVSLAMGPAPPDSRHFPR